ncbi:MULTISPECIES: hypothetical protein [unclassified Tenacibaculum]|uniref:hypothetical protein n=1 Tax=Tenacibaculum TaxID=104267 RepID=UPI00089519C2|nr:MULTISPECIES: hypothetical protein [unclassified Tenacibaculum]RBW54651.1 hypothetical protein DS884_17015 [Tenacibaculum sp. E3R01]SEE12910.1 hypothetical protein SAMN04487765_1495 [Tenacibaculum sp. MAR_2010_89]
MKKSILILGKTLSKKEQKEINGNGAIGFCDASGGCPTGSHCEGYFCVKDSTGGGNPGGGNGGGGCVPDRFCVDDNDTCCIG